MYIAPLLPYSTQDMAKIGLEPLFSCIPYPISVFRRIPIFIMAGEGCIFDRRVMRMALLHKDLVGLIIAPPYPIYTPCMATTYIDVPFTGHTHEYIVASNRH